MMMRRLTLCLLREDVQTFAAALNPDKPCDQLDLEPSTGVDGQFYRATPRPSTPSWVPFVQPLVRHDLRDTKTSSSSGLLLLRVRGRIFAITFGYGRSLLDLAKVEPQFGLRVALNLIDPAQIRSLDTKTFEDMVLTSTKQTSRNAELPAFGVDVSTDLLRAATGVPRDTNLAKRVSGSDALVMNVHTLPNELPALCERLLDAYGADDYKTDFGWIDQLSLVRDPVLLAQLNDQLAAELASGMAITTHLAVPEPINWEDIDAFKIAGTRDHEYEDLDVDAYLTQLGKKCGEVTIERLKSRRVSVRFARSDNFDDRWSLFQCLVSEQRVDGALYALIESRWFAINESLVSEVETFLTGLSTPQVQFPMSSPGEAEGDYNMRVARNTPDALLLDAKIKRPGGAASGIELCDLLTDRGEFVHVKRKARSATLSHLFAQGSVSARTFLDDGVFRDELRQHITTQFAADQRDRWLDLIPNASDPVDRSRYVVIYAVIANTSRAGLDWLPFFSKLNLMQHARQILRLGFKVSVLRIPIGTSPEN